MNSVINFAVRQSIRRYGIPTFYRDVSKVVKLNVQDPVKRQTIQKEIKSGLKSGRNIEDIINHPNIYSFIIEHQSSFESHPKLKHLYGYLKDIFF